MKTKAGLKTLQLSLLIILVLTGIIFPISLGNAGVAQVQNGILSATAGVSSGEMISVMVMLTTTALTMYSKNYTERAEERHR